jgi:two-component system, LytTR family, response regulator
LDIAEGAAPMRVLIVDGEPLARSILTGLCRATDGLEIISQADSGAAALRAIHIHQPALVLLDAVLPDMSGFELLYSLRGHAAPIPIIVTAQPQHALKAIEAQVLDYLIKPVRIERFQEAIRRARTRCEQKDIAVRAPLQTAWEANTNETPSQRHLLAGERERRLYLFTPNKIDYIESYGNYVKVWSGAAAYISRDRIKELATRLAGAGFVRIERSLLLNLHCVSYIERLSHGMFAFTLNSGTRLESTPTFRAEILRAVHPSACSMRRGTDN